MTDDVTAAGGWCAPSEVLYDHAAPVPPPERITLPQVQAMKAGIVFAPPSPVQQAAAALNERMAATMAQARHHAIETACAIAAANDWDVHVYEPPAPFSIRHADAQQLLYLRSVGIAFTPAEYPVPTLHHHPAPTYWDDDEDWTL